MVPGQPIRSTTGGVLSQPPPPLQLGQSWLLAVVLGAVAIAVLLALVVVLRRFRQRDAFEVSGATVPGDDETVYCPRCRHTTDPDASRCPECGYDLP